MKQPIVARRRALQMVGAAMLSGVAGSLLSATRNRTFAKADGMALNVFTKVSGVLTGKPGFDLALAMGLYQALRQSTLEFDAGLLALQASLEQGAGAPVRSCSSATATSAPNTRHFAAISRTPRKWRR